MDGRTGNQWKKGSKLTYNTYNICNKIIISEYHNPNKSRAARLLDSLSRWREEDNNEKTLKKSSNIDTPEGAN